MFRELKDMSKYISKDIFIISDKRWQDVLMLVPLTIWTGEEECQKGYGTPANVCVYPSLIYHGEENSFDADSIIYFTQQYAPERVNIVGEIPQELGNLLIAKKDFGAGIPNNKIQKISYQNYLSYWQTYAKVVYVEDNYKLALMASTYASLINTPLIIEGYEPVSLDLQGKKIICVGNPNVNCNEKYTLEELQKKYSEITQTDKLMLVNPKDLNIKKEVVESPILE